MVYTPKQRALMGKWQRGELKRINLIEGSVSSGKTWISLVLWAFWVSTMPQDGLYMMCAKSLTTLKRNCLLLLQELVGESNFRFSITSKEGWLFGRKIIFEGANDSRSEAKIRGLTLQGAYCDELTQFPQDFFTMLLSRLRQPGSKLIATTNPDAPSHWLMTNYIKRADELDLLDVKFLLEDNTTLPEDYVRNIKLEYTGVFYDRFILGLWTLAEGIIYPMYQDAIIDEVPDIPVSDYVVSVDYGTMNAFAAILWCKRGDIWYAEREYYHSGRKTNVQKTDEEYGKELREWIKDIAEGRQESYNVLSGYSLKKIPTIIDPSAASFIALLKKSDWARVIPADNAVIDGIRETAVALKSEKIKIKSSLKNWKDEVGGYVWDDTTGEDRPVKVDDHLMDSMRYFVKTMHIAAKKRPYKSIL